MTIPSNEKKSILEILMQCVRQNDLPMTLPINITKDDHLLVSACEKSWLPLPFTGHQSEPPSGSISIHTHHTH